MKLNGEVNQNSLLNELNNLHQENARVNSLCREYETMLTYTNQKFWSWDAINDTYRMTVIGNDSYDYNFEGNNFSIEVWKKIIHSKDIDKAEKNLKRVLDEKHEIYESTYRVQAKDLNYRWILSKGKTIKDSQGNVIKITGSHTDITEKLDLEKKFFNIAYYDSLTRLPNKEKLFNV